jgi:hypothetical protein
MRDRFGKILPLSATRNYLKSQAATVMRFQNFRLITSSGYA